MLNTRFSDACLAHINETTGAPVVSLLILDRGKLEIELATQIGSFDTKTIGCSL